MKQLRPTGCAMAALLMIAMAARCCFAGVVVLSNRTPDEVRFVLADEAQEQVYTLARQEVRTLRVSPATDLWFADDPENGYRLRGGCAYVFLRNNPDRHLELQRLGLADEQTWREQETGTLPEPSPAASSAPERGGISEERALLRVIIAFDASTHADVESWERSLRASLDKASQVASPQCGVGFEAVDFRLWQADRAAADFDTLWNAFVSAVPAEPRALVVGFTTRPVADSSCSGFPETAGPLTSHLLLHVGAPSSEREQVQSLLHALGHCLGAVHSPETDSVMTAVRAQSSTHVGAVNRFDAVNALAIALVGEELAAAPRNLADLSPRVRQRLVGIYGTLAEAAPNDPLASRFLRLLSVAPAEAPAHTEPAAEKPKESDDRSTRPEDRAVGDTEDLAMSVPPSRRDPGQTPDSRLSLPISAGQPAIEEENAHASSESGMERPAFPQALGLAIVLMAIPAVAFIWRLMDRGGARRPTGGEELAQLHWQPMQTGDRAAWSVYLASVTGVALLSSTSLFSGEVGGLKAAAVLLSAALAAMTAAPFYPMAGPLAYLVLSYAVQGDDPAGVRIENSGVLACMPALSVAALGLQFFRQRRRPSPPRGIATWILLVMMAWIGLTAAGAVVGGLPASSSMVHRLGRFSQVLAMFFVTLYAEVGLAEVRLTSLVLGLVLLARVHLFHADVSLEQNLAMLAAIACPLLFTAAQTAPSRLAKAGFYVLSAYFVSLIVYTQNRAAMAALPVAAAVLLFSSPHRKRALLIGAPLALVLVAWLLASGRLDRFAEIYQEGDFQGSAYYRLRIWTAGWHMARDHAALGVGPGNFELLIERYDPELWSIPAHNSFVQMAAETGLAGAAIYVVLILAASVQLGLIVGRHGDDWRALAAGGALASLAAHVVTGCFLENPSLAVTYVVLAGGLALATAPVTRVYRERLYLPLPDFLARPLAELAVRSPRIVSGMPLAKWSSRIRENSRYDLPPRPDFSPSRLQGQDSGWWLRMLLVLDVLLTVAGSLAPFSFRPMGVHAAVDFYCRRMSQGIEFSDRSDWLANLLLFAPLGFLAMAACRPRREGLRRIVASAFVLAGCLLFSSLIELAQVWFPSRTVNPNDVGAEALGAAAGILAFLVFGDRLSAVASAVFAGRNPLRSGEKLLLWYSAGVIVYAAWPFDVTINPTDFASKLREGRIDLADWTRPGWFVNLAISAALMVPIGALLRTLGLRQGASVRSWPALMAWGVGWLLAIEFCRLLVFSQSVGLVHLAGGAAGILIGGLARQLTGSR